MCRGSAAHAVWSIGAAQTMHRTSATTSNFYSHIFKKCSQSRALYYDFKSVFNSNVILIQAMKSDLIVKVWQ